MNVFDRIQHRQQTLDTALCLGLDPRPAWFTAADWSAGNPWLAWGQRLIAAAGDAVCCVKPNIAFYEAGGPPALDGLRATIAFAHEHDLPVLLDAKRGDIGSTAEAYAQAAYEWLGADAVTVNPYLGFDGVSPFLQDPSRGVFVLCHTSNPGAAEFQMRLVEGRPLHVVVAEQAAGWSDRAGLVVGATYPEAIIAVRRVAPAAWLLLPGVGAQGGDLAAAVAAARTRFIVPTSRALATAEDPAAAARALRDAIRSAQGQAARAKTPPPNEDLILDLHRIGAVQFGEFTLASGLSSPIYIDLRLLPSDPPSLARAAAAYADLLRGLDFNRLAAIPYAALPIGTAVALQTGWPLIYPRKEVKTHGRGRAIEGHFAPGERAVVLDDLITTGGSKVEAIQVLRDAGLVVEDVAVLIDRQASGAADLAAHGVRLHAVLTLAEIMAVLAARGAISTAQREAVERYLAGGG
jgi:uridine monophosphate synthetase